MTKSEDYKVFFKQDCIANGFKTKGLWRQIQYILSPPPIYLYLKLLRRLESLSVRECTGLKKIYRHLIYRRFNKTGRILGFEIYPFTCKGGLKLLHAGGIIINPKAQIGKNFTIRSFSVIGNKRSGFNDEVPIIGDNVEIGCNCSIIGKIRIGDDVIIGAGSVVISDIPSGSICVGNPAKVVKKLREVNNNLCY